jgi:hypothetical protein
MSPRHLQAAIALSDSESDGEAGSGSGWEAQLQSVSGKILEILQGVAERYASQGDNLSVVVLYEAVGRVGGWHLAVPRV